jgi:hypothetical protein
VIVVDAWSNEDEEAFGQRVIGGRVVVGALPAWESRLIYFKVDVSAAATRKHKVEVQVYDEFSGAEELSLLNKKASAPISVTRTTYDPVRAAFVATCDVGVFSAAIKELTVDLTTFKLGTQCVQGQDGKNEGGGQDEAERSQRPGHSDCSLHLRIVTRRPTHRARLRARLCAQAAGSPTQPGRSPSPATRPAHSSSMCTPGCS